MRIVCCLPGVALGQRAGLAVDAGLSCQSDRPLSVASASLQRGLNRGGDTYLDGDDEQGRICGLSATKRDAHWHPHDVGPFGRIVEEHKPVMVLHGSPFLAGSRPPTDGACATIETMPER